MPATTTAAKATTLAAATTLTTTATALNYSYLPGSSIAVCERGGEVASHVLQCTACKSQQMLIELSIAVAKVFKGNCARLSTV